jgi:hypothetical protein
LKNTYAASVAAVAAATAIAIKGLTAGNMAILPCGWL